MVRPPADPVARPVAHNDAHNDGMGESRLPDYEYRPLSFPRGTARDTARSVLTIHAEYGEWELDRLRLLPDGRRTAMLRRRRRRFSPALPS